MFPLSFKEFLSVSAYDQLQKVYNEYLRFSSFPYTLECSDTMTVLQDYLQGICSTVVLKDIIGRNQIADSMKLESVIRFLFDRLVIIFLPKKMVIRSYQKGKNILSYGRTLSLCSA